MRLLYFILTMPFFLIARVCVLFNIWHIRDDLNKCVHKIESADISILDVTIDYLYAAEDHRNAYHFGVDQIAILRAIHIRIFQGECQGASTVEQQCVRVITNRYEKSLARKLREQILAVSVAMNVAKSQIAKTYLMIAFYGHGRKNAVNLQAEIKGQSAAEKHRYIVGMIARLKYPEPTKLNKCWKKKIENREKYIARRLKRAKVSTGNTMPTEEVSHASK